jgi:hypothetical protein
MNRDRDSEKKMMLMMKDDEGMMKADNAGTPRTSHLIRRLTLVSVHLFKPSSIASFTSFHSLICVLNPSSLNHECEASW